jgi:hypothetical protein
MNCIDCSLYNKVARHELSSIDRRVITEFSPAAEFLSLPGEAATSKRH